MGAGTAPSLGLAAPPLPPPLVSVAVAPVSAATPEYRIQIRNGSAGAVDATVRQELPAGAAATEISDGGRAVPTGGRGIASGAPGGTAAAGGADRGMTEVIWQLRLPAGATKTLTTTLAAPPGPATLTAPACAFVGGGQMPFDCASATWDPTLNRPADAAPPWWQRPAVIGGIVAGLAVLATLVGLARLVWQRRAKLRRAESRQRAGVATYDPQASRGTLYPRPSAPRLVTHRRTPPVWLVVSAALAILAGVVTGAVWTATSRVSAIRADRQPTSGAWVGTSQVGGVGVPLRESAFEFTLYRLACPETGSGAKQQCQATVGLHNVSQQSQPWYGSLQRAYQPGGTWVPADEEATRAVNSGRDLFTVPVAPGERMLVPLVFTMPGREPPSQIELRSAVFSAGVRVNV
ncbi:hypothetical protein AB0J86_09285 [Micromonospora sp. NPDC049559]|uniref:hypothetical protein n=1 Tax=Micromonospora sp. NPDC049559 TaxID=3155923 RepID=UPI003447409C